MSEDNPVPDFKRALGDASEEDEIKDASTQMGVIIRSLITDSFGDSKYAQATECLGVMRDELINMEEPEMYNSFVRDLKKGLLSGALGGDRRDFWFKIRWSRLGLIDQDQSDVSNVTHDEAEEVRSLVEATFKGLRLANSNPSSTSRDRRQHAMGRCNVVVSIMSAACRNLLPCFRLEALQYIDKKNMNCVPAAAGTCDPSSASTSRTFVCA